MVREKKSELASKMDKDLTLIEQFRQGEISKITGRYLGALKDLDLLDRQIDLYAQDIAREEPSQYIARYREAQKDMQSRATYRMAQGRVYRAQLDLEDALDIGGERLPLRFDEPPIMCEAYDGPTIPYVSNADGDLAPVPARFDMNTEQVIQLPTNFAEVRELQKEYAKRRTA